MKKILFLLLVTISSYAQTYQNPTFGTVTTKTAPTITSVSFIASVDAIGVIGKIDPVLLPFTNGNLKSYNGDKKIVKTVKKAVFSFIWDDIQTSDPLVYNVFQDYGYIPSYAIMTNNLNSGNRDFYIDAYQKGVSILAHSVSHPDMSGTTLTNAQVNTQMVDSKKIIESYGMRVSGWVTPSSTLNAIYYPQVDKNFGYAFTNTGGAFNETVSPLRLSRVGLETAMAGHNLANVQAIIDDAIANNKMVVFYGHHLPSTYLNPDTTPYLTEADLRNILAYLKTKSDENLCEVMTTDEAIKTYYGFSSGTENNLVKWTGTLTQGNSIISDNGTSVGVGTSTLAGKLNVNTGQTTTTINIPGQLDGSISIANGGSTSFIPTIIGKSSANTGLYLQSATADGNASPDMFFNIRTVADTDYSTLNTGGFRFSRNSVNLFEVNRSGNFGYGGIANTGIKHFFYSNFATTYASSGASTNAAGDMYYLNSNNVNNGSAIIRFGAFNANGQPAQAYIGLVNTATNYESILVFGTRSGLSNYAERMRIHASGAISFFNTTDPGVGIVSVTGKVQGSAPPTVGIDLTNKTYVDGLVRPYKVYTAMISQVSTSAPTVTVMENTIGAIVWTRSGVGTYLGTLVGAFTASKTLPIVSNNANINNNIKELLTRASSDVVQLQTYSNTVLADGTISNMTIEIRVYN